MASVICWSRIAGKKYNSKEIKQRKCVYLAVLETKKYCLSRRKEFFSPKRQGRAN